MGKFVGQRAEDYWREHYTAVGEARGELQANQKTLIRLLLQRFQSLDSSIRQKIESCADNDLLVANIDKAITSSSLSLGDLQF